MSILGFTFKSQVVNFAVYFSQCVTIKFRCNPWLHRLQLCGLLFGNFFCRLLVRLSRANKIAILLRECRATNQSEKCN